MFRLTTTKTIGGKSVSIPAITTETESKARQSFEDAIEAAEQELNEPMIRYVGGARRTLFRAKPGNVRRGRYDFMGAHRSSIEFTEGANNYPIICLFTLNPANQGLYNIHRRGNV